MSRFQKTRLHVVSAVLILLGLYALGGLAYAASVHSVESIRIWAGVAVGAFVASAACQRYVATKRKRAP